jgi:hypothetical protein
MTPRLAVILILVILPPAVYTLGDNEVVYVGGSHRGDFRREPGPGPGGTFGMEIKGTVSKASASEFVFDAGRRGSLSIRYDQIMKMVYGPGFSIRPDLPRRTSPPSKYRWSNTWIHSADQYFLALRYHDTAGFERQASFELGRSLVRTLLKQFEERSGKPIEFSVISACLLYRTSDECEYGSPTELRGFKWIFVDTFGNSNMSDARDRIVDAIQKAKIDVEFVTEPQRAEIVLNFKGMSSSAADSSTFGGQRRGTGEVYVAHGGGLRLVSFFEVQNATIIRAHPATKFGETFAEIYKKANGVP